jgi:hypothetical protein
MQCLFCGHLVQMVHVHGHYQCPVCNTNALPCCDGDNCSTNQLLADNILSEPNIPKKSTHGSIDQNQFF